jgi:pimeloyl-ACP methyl ester carboxylesterase
MPTMSYNGVTLYYEEHGSGFPLLLFAPGGMHSVVEFWERMPYNPIEALSDTFRVIAIDQRNAGRSHAPLRAAGWEDYAADAVALLDHLGIRQTHIMGGCIGSSFCLALIQRAPERVTAAVLQNPIGLTQTNRPLFQGGFEDAAAHAETQGMAAVIAAARENAAFWENRPAGPWGARALADPDFAATLAGMPPAEYAAIVRGVRPALHDAAARPRRQRRLPPHRHRRTDRRPRPQRRARVPVARTGRGAAHYREGQAVPDPTHAARLKGAPHAPRRRVPVCITPLG